MKRKTYSNNNDLHIRLSDAQYKRVYNLSNSIGCSKVDVIRYLLSNPTRLNQHDLNVLKRSENKLTDILNRYYMNLYRIGNNLNQAVHNQNLELKRGRHATLKINLIKIGKSINYVTKLINDCLKNEDV